MAYTDTFTGTNGTELSAYNANWVDAGDGVNMQINNNTVETTGGAFHGYYYNQTFASKHYGKLTIKGGRFIGPAIRMAAGANYYYCFGSVSSNSYPGQVVAGSATDWDSGQAQVNVGDILELAIDVTTEGTVHYKVNGSLVTTYTSKTALSGGRVGIAAYAAGAPSGREYCAPAPRRPPRRRAGGRLLHVLPQRTRRTALESRRHR